MLLVSNSIIRHLAWPALQVLVQASMPLAQWVEHSGRVISKSGWSQNLQSPQVFIQSNFEKLLQDSAVNSVSWEIITGLSVLVALGFFLGSMLVLGALGNAVASWTALAHLDWPALQTLVQVSMPEAHSVEHSGRFEPPGTRLHKLQSPQDSVQSNDEK